MLFFEAVWINITTLVPVVVGFGVVIRIKTIGAKENSYALVKRFSRM
jgi:hypothetical protein